MLVSWVLFPLLFAALCLGCGLLLEACVGRRLPGALLGPAGFTAVVVIAGVFTSRGETASLATPAAALAAVAGAALGYFRRPPRDPSGSEGDSPSAGPRWRLDGWALAAAFAVFAVFAAPVVLSGHPTFVGYIKLDDTATWLAFVDRVMSHGRDLAGLEPSSYQTTLQVNLPAGYPVGAFLPLGVGTQLTGTDPAWLFQPYMATMAALLSLALYWLARPLVESRPLRALVAFGAAQSALLFAYSLWGGIKEVAVAVAIAALAAVVPTAMRSKAGWRAVLPAAVASAALLDILGTRGAALILPILALGAFAIWRESGVRALLARAWPFALAALLLAVPAVFIAGAFSPAAGTIASATELGNLVRPLRLSQYVGIWPTGDFRFDPANGSLTTYLIALALASFLAGAIIAWRRHAWEPLLYSAGASAGCLAVFAYSAPWVGAKALAFGSPAVLLLALAGAAAFAIRVERVLGATVLALLLAGVLWSNALGYHDVSLAPYDQLRELESIGKEFAGEGPTLMTEYQPYGVRHFLRATDAEGASELRSRSIPLLDGSELEKGEWGDTDQISQPALLTYRTLVLRRNPAQSRPPSVYKRVRHGDYYDVWQRPVDTTEAIAEQVPFGDSEDPAATPSCAEVLKTAAVVGPGGELAAVERAPTVTAPLSAATYPSSWLPVEAGGPALVPHGAGTAQIQVRVPTPGRYGVYLEGSVRNRLTALVDGREVGSISEQLNEARQFLYFGDVALRAGTHDVALVLGGQTLAPGSGGPPEAIGPLVLSSVANEDPPVRRLPAADAGELCGKHLDWIEVLR